MSHMVRNPLSSYASPVRTILLLSPYWKEPHRWMVSSVKLAELWQRLGYRVVVVCMGEARSGERLAVSGEKTEETEQLRVWGKNVTREDVSETLRIYRKKDWFLPDPLNFGIALGFTGLVRRILTEEKPDLIVCNKVLFWTSFATIPLRLAGHRVLLLTDALVGITWQARGFFPRLLMRIGAWTVGWLVLLSARKIVTFHPQPENVLRRLGIARKTEVIPTGIDVAQFPVTRFADALKNEQLFGSAEERVATVSYVGRLESVKGVDDFLAAAVRIKKEFPKVKFQVVGWYKENHPLVMEYQRQVIFSGLRHDIPAVLRETDIFVLPSYSEGLSNALMEAMASGCACVATDVGGNRFLIQNGISGFLFSPGDREALTAHLRRLLGDPAKQRAIGKAARARIEEMFDWSVVGKRYEELFEKLIVESG